MYIRIYINTLAIRYSLLSALCDNWGFDLRVFELKALMTYDFRSLHSPNNPNNPETNHIYIT